MSSQTGSEIKLEIGHVLFIDIVGYSKLLIDQQSRQFETLRRVVRATEAFRVAEADGKLLRLPTGDGGALVFRNSPDAPVLCAVEIARDLKKYPDLQVRMGIHSGPVNAITDLNEQANIAGAGINIAQRVMDCGDAGHILLSKHVAEDLEHYHRWKPYLHDLGECEVKHGVRVSLVNLYNDEVGNPTLPEKLKPAQPIATSAPQPAKPKPISRAIMITVGAAVLIVAGIFLSRQFVSRGSDSASTGAISPKSVAVLPFENLSSDKENAYFSDGVQDEILTRLSKIADLKVISRTSTRQFASVPKSLRDVGKQLGVANVLEGSVQKIANAVHVNVQLIRAATDEHLWAESYNRKLDDVFAVEGEVAGTIAEQLNAKLTGAEQKAIAEKPTQNTAAHDAYIRGRDIINSQTMTLESAPNAEAEFLRAVQFDPSFAAAWSELAVIRSFLYFNGLTSAASVKDAVDRAVALQPDSGEAWLAQAVYRYRVLRNFPSALEAYREAQKRLPNSSDVLFEMGHLERRLGQKEAAEKDYRAAIQLDPRNVDVFDTLTELLGNEGRYREAEDVLDQALTISPGNEELLNSKALNLQAQGRLSESAAVLSLINPDSPSVDVAVARAQQLIWERRFEDALAFERAGKPAAWVNDPRTLVGTGLTALDAGHKDEAETYFSRALTAMKGSDGKIPIDTRLLPSFASTAYAGLGEKEQALETAQQALSAYNDDALALPGVELRVAMTKLLLGDNQGALASLEKAVQSKAVNLRPVLRFASVWDPLRKDPRFQKLCEQPNK